MVLGLAAVQGFSSNSLFWCRSPVQINNLHHSNLLDTQTHLCFPNTSALSSINCKTEALKLITSAQTQWILLMPLQEAVWPSSGIWLEDPISARPGKPARRLAKGDKSFGEFGKASNKPQGGSWFWVGIKLWLCWTGLDETNDLGQNGCWQLSVLNCFGSFVFPLWAQAPSLTDMAPWEKFKLN